MLIETKGIQKIYEVGEVPTRALRGVSFAIKEGEFLAVMGQSGSGKSTLLHILGLLDRPTHGEYFLDGKRIDTYTTDEVAHIRNKDMGFVFQMFNLLARTSVMENVKLPLLYSNIPESQWDDKAARAIEAVGLTHRILHTTAQLSGGERQRVAIARALINDPRIIFADEPTGNLDSESGGMVMETIQKLNEEQGRTVILITHETYTAEHASRIIRLHDGGIESDIKVEHRHKANNFAK